MPPQITCPYCGNTIGLENRKEVDFEKIMHSLGKSPRTFTELLTLTNLPRKTLSLRLKELCASGSIMKDGGYHLNPSIASAKGTSGKRNGNGKMNQTILHIKKHVEWIPIALIICLVVVAFGSALMISPPAPSSAPISATFYYTPSSNIVTGLNLTFVSVSDGPATNYNWNFGDGATGTGAIVSHAYTENGTYDVTLSVTSSEGAIRSITQQLQILPAATIYVEPLPTQYQVGDNITLNIMISNVSDLWGWQAGMTFNPSVLQCITMPNPSNTAPNVTSPTTAFTEGDFLRRGGSTIWVPNWVTNGTIIACGCSLLYPETPQSGSGTLATVTFKVIGEGSLDIHLADVILVDLNDNEIPVNVAT